MVNKGAKASVALTLEASQQFRASAKHPYATNVFIQQNNNNPSCKKDNWKRLVGVINGSKAKIENQ